MDVEANISRMEFRNKQVATKIIKSENKITKRILEGVRRKRRK